ncbi:SAM-dependent methyltransferase [Sphingomonas sp. AX6]|uniref:SAM-dependent methyltransferase n=1 Tax=Sphingomonas sp. AX6 TaxID=2653171 RepID=UPI0012F430E1|nr:class I SAM-dependent methyltransferase [Sphingomonas sp. AX6]VXC77365.1 Class I SAM-dependent methyltransferase [Sphingomonas sp. AX6]
MSVRIRIVALLLTLLVVGSIGVGARCLSATSARCTPSTLFSGGPALDVPYAETRTEAVEKMLDMAAVGPGDRVIDLGTGDGRMLLQAAARGASGLGVDIDAVLVADANASADRQGVGDRVTFRTQDLFETPIADADVVTMFLLPEINLKLRPRLLSELRPGARVVSHAFTMGDWKPDLAERVGGSRLYLWVIPADVSGVWRLRDADGQRVMTLDQTFQTFTGDLGQGGAVFDGRVDGEWVAFTVREGERSVRYEGRVQGDTIVGTIPYRWEATRGS